jgi:CRP/FNR family transcriptional regulator, cyclic AMP receptor protein
MKRHDSPILERRSITKDQVLIQEGDFGHQAYLIQSGEMKVYLTKDGEEVELARLGAGQIVGEMALVFDGPRTASVKAIADSNLIVISRTMFEDKLKDSDATIRAIVMMLSRRILDSNNTLIKNRGDVRDLKDAAQTVYENIAVKVPMNQLYTLQNTVLPKLKELFEALDSFSDRYGE